MSSLYEISMEYLDILNNLEIDEETGEILNITKLNNIATSFETKAENIACYIKNQDAFATALRTEEKALADRRKRAEKKAEHLKNYLSTWLQALSRDRLETSRVQLSFRMSESIQISDESLLPEYCLRIKTVKEPDKTAIKEAIKNGEQVPGASLVENQNLQIK